MNYFYVSIVQLNSSAWNERHKNHDPFNDTVIFQILCLCLRFPFAAKNATMCSAQINYYDDTIYWSPTMAARKRHAR